MMEKYMKKNLQALLEIHSPTGDTENGENFIFERLENFGLNPVKTRRGEIYGVIPGKNKTKTKMIAAHLDTLGAMIRRVKDDGRLEFVRLGGYSLSTISGEYCHIKAQDGKIYSGTILPNKASVHIFKDKEIEDCVKEADFEIRLDANVDNAKDVEKLGILPGCFAYLDPRTQITSSDHIKSRFLDDKAGCIAILGAVYHLLGKNKKIEDIKPKNSVILYFSNHEETGQGNMATIPEEVEQLLVMDMGVVGKNHYGNEKKVSICPKDSTGPFDLKMTNRLKELAEKNNIPFVLDIFLKYGSDAAVALEHGRDLRCALIGPGIDSSHFMERTHMEGLVAAARLAAYWIMD